MKHLYTENYKVLLKEIKEDLNKWKNPMLMVWKCNVVKMAIFSKLSYSVKAISIKIPGEFFAEIDKLIIKVI